LDELEDIFSTFMGAFCLPLLDEMFVCLFDDSDDEKSDARFNSLSLSLSFSLVAAVFIAFFWLRVVVCF
jgi:hypothetical protein